jgi:hypothetical protein
LSYKNFILILWLCLAILLTANFFVVFNGTLADRHYSFAWRFYFDRRLNFPFLFSLFLQLTNLFLLVKIISKKSLTAPQSVFWKALLVAFFLFALDETFYIHQYFKMSTFGVIASYDRSSWSHYLWVIPYFVVFGTLFLMLFIYSAHISTVLKKKIAIAGVVFLFGAVLMEFAGTYYAVVNPEADVYLLLIKSAEGVLQMAGSIMFIEAFLYKLKAKTPLS